MATDNIAFRCDRCGKRTSTSEGYNLSLAAEVRPVAIRAKLCAVCAAWIVRAMNWTNGIGGNTNMTL